MAVDERQAAIAELRALAAEVREDLAAQDSELAEMALLVKQMASEVDRLTPLRNDANKRAREMENNLEHFPRSEVARVFSASAEAQMRLFVMQSQLEQLEYKQKALERSRRNLLRFVGLVDQVPTDAPEAAASIAGSTASLREVIAQVVHAEEGERQRCALAVHDGSAQVLTNLVLRIQLCQRLLDSDAERGRQELAQMQEAMGAALQESRRLIYDLRPVTIEEVGLYTALRKYVQAQSDRSAAPIQLEISGPEHRLEEWAEIAVFRLVQEALSNAVRHAQARAIRVTVDTAEARLRARVEDDGVGFDPPSSVALARARRQLGLAALLERAALVEGSASIDSATGRGTRVQIEVPL